jgi:hypothetical protein
MHLDFCVTCTQLVLSGPPSNADVSQYTHLPFFDGPRTQSRCNGELGGGTGHRRLRNLSLSSAQICKGTQTSKGVHLRERSVRLTENLFNGRWGAVGCEYLLVLLRQKTALTVVSTPTRSTLCNVLAVPWPRYGNEYSCLGEDRLNPWLEEGAKAARS